MGYEFKLKGCVAECAAVYSRAPGSPPKCHLTNRYMYKHKFEKNGDM